MKAKAIPILFGLTAAAQLAVPAFQIWKYEDTLRTGQVFKFRTAPVDPYDAFRGRYVQLGYANTTVKDVATSTDSASHRIQAYVTLGVDSEGFVTFEKLLSTPPEEGAYLRVEADHSSIVLPFDRFYMEESLAPLAEKAYRNVNRRGENSEHAAWVSVRVKKGRGVIENLFIDNVPIGDFLKKKK